MKFGKKRSPEPEPIDITERLSILDLRSSVQSGDVTPVSAGLAAPARVATPAAPAPSPGPAPAPAAPVAAAVVATAPEVRAPAPPEPVVEPAATPEPVVEPAATPEPVAVVEPAAPVQAGGWGAPAPVQHQAPDPVAYEMAAFELNLPPATHAQPVAQDEPVAQPEPVAQAEPEPELVVEPEPEPVVEPEPVAVVEPAIEPEPEPVAITEPAPVEAPAPPAWSYEQVARIEDAEQHVSAWVPPQPVVESAPEPEPVAIEADLPEQRADDDEHVLDLSEPAAVVDLVEHDPVYAAVEAAQSQERADDEVIRWHW